MKIDYTKCNPALLSIIKNSNQIITLDTNILIPPYRTGYPYDTFKYNEIWIQPLFNAFPKLAIHEAVLEEFVEQNIKKAVYFLIDSDPPKLILHKDSDLSQYEMALRNTIEAKIATYTRYNPALDNKDDRGEVKSLAFIAAKGLIYFATRDSNAIQLIDQAHILNTSLDGLLSLKQFEIIYYLFKKGYSEKDDMRFLYKYIYYLTKKEKNENLGWGDYIRKMEELYPDI